MRGAAFAVWLLAASVLAQTPEPAVPAPPTQLERSLLAELDGELCVDALRLLEFLGRARHVPAIAAKLDGERAAVRAASARTLGIVAGRDPSAAGAVHAALRRALRDGSRTVQQAAVFAWRSTKDVDVGDLEALLADQDVTLRVTAAGRLVSAGVAPHDRDVAALLREALGTPAQRHAVALFDAVRSPGDAELLQPYLDADRPEQRFRAREALERLAATAAGAPDPRPPSQRVREAGDASNRAATARLLALPWREVARDELLARAAAARLVLFGEMHHTHGPLRDAQRLVLRVMVAAAPGRVVLGYEPSVASSQRSVIDLARELGVEAIPLETRWEQRVPEDRVWERDDEAASIVNARLAADPGCRMLVVRGEGHTKPDGHLVRQLAVAPMIVSTTECPPVEAFVGRVDGLGRTFRIGDGDVWSWSDRDWLGTVPVLAERLAQRLAPPLASVLAPLEHAVLSLLDGDHRAAALRVLADCGTAAHDERIGELLRDDRSEVRAAAASALGAIAARDPSAAEGVQDALQRALRDDDETVRRAALHAFPARAGCDWSALERMLAVTDPATRLTAANRLVRCGVALHPGHLAAVLRDGVGTAHETELLPVFGEARTPADADALRPYLASADLEVRERARATIARLEAIANGRNVEWPDTMAEHADAVVAAAARRAQWQEVAIRDVLRELAAARLVLLGTGARDAAALRATCLAVLRAMGGAAPERVVLAADVSAPGGAELAAAARATGVAVLELATGWRDRRDERVAAVLAGRLLSDPECRMLVACSASHAIPGAWLSRQLPVEPCIVRTDERPPLAALGARAATAGRVFRRGSARSLAWALDDVFADAGLRAWADAWQPPGR